MHRLSAGVALGLLAALTVSTLVLADRRPEESLVGGSGSLLALEAVVGVALAVAGALVWAYRAAPVAGTLLLAAAVAVDARALPLPDAGGAVLFTLALTLGTAAPALAGAGALALAGRVGRAQALVALAAVAACVVWAGALPTTLFDPPAAGCFSCPRNLLLLHGAPELRAHILHSGVRVAAVTSVALALVLLTRIAGRRSHWSVVLSQAGAALALAASAVALWREPTRVTWALECAGLGLVAAGPLAEITRARIQSTRIVDAVLRTVPNAEELRAALAQSTGDRSLALVFPRDGAAAVEGDGAPASPAVDGTVTTDILRAGESVAQLRHGELSPQAARRLEDAVRAAGLALEHTSSRARLRAELADLTASRARIVEIADAERRRLERNLHDGAQQRLIALSEALGAASHPPAVAEARAEVLAALEELRTLAHGIHPASLSDGGIVPSVRELADASNVPLRLDVRPLDRLPTRIESAAYRVVVECVRTAERHGRGDTVSVALAMGELGLTATVRLPGVPPDVVRRELRHADDRVTAAGGELAVEANGSGETVVELRCAS